MAQVIGPLMAGETEPACCDNVSAAAAGWTVLADATPVRLSPPITTAVPAMPATRLRKFLMFIFFSCSGLTRLSYLSAADDIGGVTRQSDELHSFGALE